MNAEIKEYLQNIQDNVLSTLCTENFIEFNDIDNFPTGRGIYFIYDKNKTLVYIGAAMNIQKRCKQYISSKNTGATFRYNLIQDEEEIKCTIKKIKDMIELNETYVDIIKNDYSAKFILIQKTEKDIAYEETVYIAAFNPKLNKFNL